MLVQLAGRNVHGAGGTNGAEWPFPNISNGTQYCWKYPSAQQLRVPDRADWYKDSGPGMLTFRNAAVTEAQGSVSVGNESVWTFR